MPAVNKGDMMERPGFPSITGVPFGGGGTPAAASIFRRATATQILTGEEAAMTRLVFLIAIILSASGPALAQAWPTKPVRVIVNVAPGGVADVVARLLGKTLSDNLGQQFVVENRGGGEGYIGSMAVGAAAPDGYTILFSPGSSMMITPHIVPRADFVPVDELTPVAPTVRTTLSLIARSNFPAKDFAEFVAHARANPGKVNYGSAGTGTGLHIAAEQLKLAARIDVMHIPFRGAGPALNDLLGGHIDFMFDPGVGVEHSKAGRVRIYAIAGAKRHPEFPNIPTFAELGLDVDSGPYFAYYAPKGTARDLVVRLNSEVARAMQAAEVRQRLDALGLEGTQMPPGEFAEYVKVQNQRYAKLVRDLGLDKKQN
jgi:tripartite-type tricarboxylate transporter receptor subunit TctC